MQKIGIKKGRMPGKTTQEIPTKKRCRSYGHISNSEKEWRSLRSSWAAEAKSVRVSKSTILDKGEQATTFELRASIVLNNLNRQTFGKKHRWNFAASSAPPRWCGSSSSYRSTRPVSQALLLVPYKCKSCLVHPISEKNIKNIGRLVLGCVEADFCN